MTPNSTIVMKHVLIRKLQLLRLSMRAEKMYLYIRFYCDADGIVPDDPRGLGVEVFGSRRNAAKNAKAALKELQERGLIIRQDGLIGCPFVWSESPTKYPKANPLIELMYKKEAVDKLIFEMQKMTSHEHKNVDDRSENDQSLTSHEHENVDDRSLNPPMTGHMTVRHPEYIQELAEEFRSASGRKLPHSFSLGSGLASAGERMPLTPSGSVPERQAVTPEGQEQAAGPYLAMEAHYGENAGGEREDIRRILQTLSEDFGYARLFSEQLVGKILTSFQTARDFGVWADDAAKRAKTGPKLLSWIHMELKRG